MELSQTAIIALSLLLAGWTFGAGALAAWAMGKARKAELARSTAQRLGRMVDDAPAVPLLVRGDGRIEAPARLAAWLGLDSVPEYLSELDSGEQGLPAETLEELTSKVKAVQKSAAPFRMVATPRGSTRSLAVHGHLADPQISPGGAALVWFFDFSESETELARLRNESQRARADFAALVGLIEAAPMPMWFRGGDGALRLVNDAYVSAVGAEDADAVVQQGIELIEPIDNRSARETALEAAKSGEPLERQVNATVGGQRRTLRVSDLPVGSDGIAGYAVDIEDMELLAREFREFRKAQRSMLDQLSVGVAQFDAGKRLFFANRPFQRIFALSAADLAATPDFDRWLDQARDEGRLPETRDFPAWRAELAEWFASGVTQDESWSLSDGTHLRIVAQPMPDGGLVLVAEDQTEQLSIAATRDTLLRTRTATFDSLFESLAVFAPDGRLQLWNRSFASIWGLDDDYLDKHPRVDAIMEQVSSSLVNSRHTKAIGETVRAATLDRKRRGGRATLSDGRILEFAGVPLPDGNGLLTVLDVTDSHKAEAALRERNQALEEADKVKTRFLANMSYEFRTPLTSIGGFAELLQSGVAGDLGEQGQEYVANILASVERLSAQIETVLDLSQSEAGLLPLELAETDVFSFVTELVRKRADAIEQGGLSLDLRGSAASAGTLRIDTRRFGQAIGHLLDNAIAATASGGKILVDVSRTKAGTQIVVSDNGKGMTKRELARALEGLKLADDGKAVERRQGLGIPLARQLVEAHGGKLKIISEKGVGTTAAITMP